MILTLIDYLYSFFLSFINFQGESCGLVKNLSLLSHVTADEDVTVINRLIFDLGVEDVTLLTGEEVNYFSFNNTFFIFFRFNKNILIIFKFLLI